MEANKGQDLTTSPPPSSVTTHSPWHSPVPYLFGGLAGMLGLIAFALLILACSYWKLSGYLDGGRRDGGSPGEGDIEAGTGEGGSNPVFEEKILVIMAGEKKPTFLATPVCSRSSSFAAGSNNCSCAVDKAERSEVALENSTAAKEHGSSDPEGQ